MDKLNILIVEDDYETCEKFVKSMENFPDIRIVHITNNSYNALEQLNVLIPDVIILDLELHTGSGSGIDFLSGINTMNISRFPYILVTTNNSSQVTYELARQLGADFIISKHQNNYSEEYVLNFIRMMKTAILNKTKSSALSNLSPESPLVTAKQLKKRITRELDLFGISPRVVGYEYLSDAIFMLAEKPVSNVSRILGEKYKRTSSSVERAMQNAINSAWRRLSVQELSQLYTAIIRSEKGVPTILEFTTYLARKVKNDI